MKKLICLFFVLFLAVFSYSQNNTPKTESVIRLSVFNPGIEFAFSVSERSIISIGTGIGFEGAYFNLIEDSSNEDYENYILAPYADFRHKTFYNLKKRNSIGKNISHNSGNYFGTRFLIRGKAIESNFTRTSNADYSFGPVWGLQRSNKTFFFQIDMGPLFYFDGQGNSGLYPFMLDINLGFNLKRF